MTTTKKESETGWFYHAPYKAKANAEPVGAPPASQIPGLSDLSTQPEPEAKKMWIRETDSKYIVLAKQGGRPDLLRYRSPKPRNDEPQGYPRCEWYYHDTGHASQQDPQEDYQFMLPDYMVHKEWDVNKNRNTGGSASSKRAPFAYDKDSIFVKDQSPNDKTVKLPEIQPSGYGVRAGKLQGKNIKHAPIQRTQLIKPQAETDAGKLKYEPAPQTSEEERPVMGKLLSHGYVSDWEGERDKWFTKQQRNKAKYDAQHTHHADPKVLSEYQETMKGRQGSSQKNRPSAGSQQAQEARKPAAHSRSHRHTNDESDPGLFKLSKFKNVGPKTETRRVYPHQQVHGHGDNPITHETSHYGGDNQRTPSMVTPVAM